MNVQPHRLVYFSRNRVVGTPADLAETVRHILETARRNNARMNITGALMFNAGCFAQVLEGPRQAVELVFERIQRDERHGDVTILGFAPVSGRTFGDWSMGFVGASIEDGNRYGAITGEGGFDVHGMTGEAVFETLRRLALAEEGVAS